MENEILKKISQLSPQVKDIISSDDFLSRLEELEDQYGIKAIFIFLQLLLQEIEYSSLLDKLKADYGINDFLAKEIKNKFSELIKDLNERNANQKSLDSDINENATSVINNQGNSAVIPEVSGPMTFSREDEEEIKQYKKTTMPDFSTIDYSVTIDRIIADLNLDLSENVLLKRFQNIVSSRFKGIRDDIETIDILIKDRKTGGMEFSKEQADLILKSIKNYQNNPTIISVPEKSNIPTVKVLSNKDSNESTKAKDRRSITIEEEDGLPVVRMPSANLPMDLSDELPAVIIGQTRSESTQELPKVAQNGKIKETIDIVGNKDLPSIKIIQKNSTTETLKENLLKSYPEEENVVFKKMPAPSPAPYVANKNIPETVLNSKTANRPNLDDVRFEKRLAGPIDELENMTLIDFRRLAADPEVSASKVKEKIELLSSQGFGKRVEGIEAWHHNEINKFYRLLGQAAMSEGKSLEEVVKERLMSGKPTLSIDELHAIIELNKSLRF